MTVPLNYYRLSFWKKFTPERNLLYINDSDKDNFDYYAENLHEEIYSWQTEEAVFNGIANEAIRDQITLTLKEKFNPYLSPQKRGIEELKEFLIYVEKILNSDQSEWTNTLSGTNNFDSLEQEFKINALLAFYLHLKWLSDCFEEPGISVSFQ